MESVAFVTNSLTSGNNWYNMLTPRSRWLPKSSMESMTRIVAATMKFWITCAFQTIYVCSNTEFRMCEWIWMVQVYETIESLASPQTVLSLDVKYWLNENSN